MKDEDSIVLAMESLGVLSRQSTEALHNIVTKNRATGKITESLLGAKRKGQELVMQFLGNRLVQNLGTGKALSSYYKEISKNKSLTFEGLHTEKLFQTNKEKKKVDKDFMQKLVVACDAGRRIDL